MNKLAFFFFIRFCLYIFNRICVKEDLYEKKFDEVNKEQVKFDSEDI